MEDRRYPRPDPAVPAFAGIATVPGEFILPLVEAIVDLGLKAARVTRTLIGR